MTRTLTFLLTTLIVLVSAATARAASLGYRQNGNAFSLYVNGQTTVFDSFQVDITPASGASFTNIVSGQVGGVPLRAGQPATYRNRSLDLEVADGGKGWLIPLGGVVINSTMLSYGATSGVLPINTALENNLGYLFLANVNVEPTVQFPTRPFNAQVVLVNQGTTVQTLTGSFAVELPPIPEPASSSLAGLALAALAARGRWRRP
jgi:hypothetical protein